MRLIRSGLWQHHDFMKLLGASVVSDVGSQITLLAVPLAAILTLDASPVQMGVLTAIGRVPALLFGLVVGVWVDRLPRRRLLIVSDLGRAALLLVIPVAWELGVLRIEVLYLVTFLAGCLTIVFDVAHTSYVPSLVRRDDLTEANSKLEISYAAAQAAGPGLAGTLVGLVTAPLAILADAVSFLVSALFLWRIRATEPAPERHGPSQPVLAEVAEGLRTVFGDATLRAMAAASASCNLFGWVFLAVYTLFMVEDLHLGPGAIGAIFSVGGVGALLGALAAQPAARRLGVGPSIVVAWLLFGLCGIFVPVAVFVPDLAVPMVGLSEFLQWMMLLIASVNQVSLRQAITPNRVLGRVNATVRFLVLGATAAGSLLGGALGEWIGLRETLLAGIVGMLLGVGWAYFSPLRTLREMPEGPEPAPAPRADQPVTASELVDVD